MNYKQLKALEVKVAHGVKDIKRRSEEHSRDRELAQQYKEGNEDAGFELLSTYPDVLSQIYNHPTKTQYRRNIRVYVYWTPEDKENLFQEIVIHFFRLIDEYDPEVGNFEGIVKGNLHLRVFNSFVQDLLNNKLKETNDKELQYFSTDDNYLFVDESKRDLPSEHLELYNAINHLKKREREVLMLNAINGWTSKEIGEELGITAGTARWHLKKALDKLKNILNEEDFIHGK